MAAELLQKYVPETALEFLKLWFEKHRLHLHISRSRNSKLGDYRRMKDGSHKITINHNLQPDFFFFVLTHELAHLIAFDSHKQKRIAPHGNEWKTIYRNMLHQSLDVYPAELKPHILEFSKSPKANFMASGELVRYFNQDNIKENELLIEELLPDDRFSYRNQTYVIREKRKKNYLCENVSSGRKYIFKALAKVEKSE